MKIKKNNLYLAGIVLLVLVGMIFVFSDSGRAAVQKADGGNGGDLQIVKLYVEGGEYVLEPSELKKGARVRLEADMARMPGCSRSIVIPAFGVAKSFSGNDNVVEFVPDKAGKFVIACSMNMYRGEFDVLESDGSKSDYEELNFEREGSSCSMGGCGCRG